MGWVVAADKQSVTNPIGIVLRVGDIGEFGRSGDGAEKSRAKIVSVNRTRLKVSLLEERGRNGHYSPGQVWTVAFPLWTILSSQGTPEVPEPIYLRQPEVVMGEIFGVYCLLQPFNLLGYAGGLLADAKVRQAELNVQLETLQAEWGKPVTLEYCMAWMQGHKDLCDKVRREHELKIAEAAKVLAAKKARALKTKQSRIARELKNQGYSIR